MIEKKEPPQFFFLVRKEGSAHAIRVDFIFHVCRFSLPLPEARLRSHFFGDCFFARAFSAFLQGLLMRAQRQRVEGTERDSGERPAGRAQLLASGRMQRLQELVPVRNGPQCGVTAP